MFKYCFFSAHLRAKLEEIEKIKAEGDLAGSGGQRNILGGRHLGVGVIF